LSITSPRELWCIELGLIDYDQAHVFQRAAARLRVREDISQDLLILCEHPAVVTSGRSSKEGHVLASSEQLAQHGITLRDVERGGDVTIHEPGQLVGYPIVKLTRHRQDLHWYLRHVEEALILATEELGLPTGRRAGQTGVWIDDRKLASIGVHAREWVTSHGFALNAHNSLATFDWIVPCGIPDVIMTSVVRECAEHHVPAPDAQALRALVADRFAQVFTLSARTAPHEIVSAIRAEIQPLGM
jgi:lipoate-protein ligase B